MNNNNIDFLIHWDDPRLRIPLPEENLEDAQLGKIAERVRAVQLDRGGYGLSAIQLGLAHRLFVMGVEESFRVVCINPKILDSSKVSVTIEEGCLSNPYLFLKVRRPDWVVASWTDVDGVYTENMLNGISARVFQHEYDHQEGILFTDPSRSSWVDRAQASDRKKKILRTNRRNASDQQDQRRIDRRIERESLAVASTIVGDKS